ncbi:hypothetical protein AB205_0032210 [Aquarana catesbeiana]|uniref:Uncharacterized protein n=1 Tax=Aquarana catesbeiana TaxID=8400 RepID=A0A2G9RTM3_AQUCT|nr:hypothetical protein AB205_0032210 [Aquarana catesbeiana]
MVRPQIEGAGSVQKNQEGAEKREKRLGTSEDTRDPPPPKEGEIPTPQAEDEEGEVYEVGKTVTTTGDVDVVEEESHFTSESAQILGGDWGAIVI